MSEHPPPPEPSHEWVEVTTQQDLQRHYLCTGCGATYAEPIDACREGK